MQKNTELIRSLLFLIWIIAVYACYAHATLLHKILPILQKVPV